MLNVRFTTLRIVGQTYGAYPDPLERDPMHVLAERLPRAADVQATLDGVRNAWGGAALPNWTAVKAAARATVNSALSTLGAFQLVEQEAVTYRPVYDLSGNQIGHDTVGWVYDGENLWHQAVMNNQGVFEYGIVGCIVMAVQKI